MDFQEIHERPKRGRKMVTAAKIGGGGGGEVVQVHGGHIIRSTAGKKDRHSKVYTAKGPRDRRVRLAAHTAIQFYDVQDRLGYDRPSKAVDWLMEKAKDAIDKLERLPPFDPNANAVSYNGPDLTEEVAVEPGQALMETGLEGFVGGSGYPHRDLCLSLQSYGGGFGQEPAFPAGWPSEANDAAEMGRFSRLLAWNDGGGGGGGGGTLESSFHSQPLINPVWDDLHVGPGAHMEPLRFMGYCVPPEMGGGGGGGEEVHGMMVAHHHHHGGSNSMSTTTDSSH